ncbi:hypothetical protein [Streptomyces sp. NPDC089799]|uniref:hypothetical protein n=1 Tax=Streptomyces sp. NPDC089799 TaxID=3155066 RepID=UPI003434B2A5
MSRERAQGRGWVRIPASRAEQPPVAPAPGPPGAAPAHASPYDRDRDRDRDRTAGPFPSAVSTAPAIYLSLVKRWREAGRTLPGHPDEEWERLISKPCWPGP